jgi:CDP-diacylglycerol--serine O-phosphatidyltransferase
MYQFLRTGWAGHVNGINVSIVYLFPAFLIAGAAAYRLAKFNIDQGQHSFFKGVPTPAVGLLVASFPLIYWYQYNKIGQFMGSVYFLPFMYFLILLLFFLMVSNIPMFSFKIKSIAIASIIHILLLLIIAVVSFFIFYWLAIPIVFLSYLVLSVIFKRKFVQ